jgi:hypothetical protein
MKSLFVAAVLLISTSAFANSFDQFVGEFKISGSPQIRSENAKFCNRFNFKNIVGIKVEKNTNGYQQSHMIYFQNPTGWAGHPVMDFTFTNDFKIGGSYAKTSGSDHSASNEYGTWGSNRDYKETIRVILTESGSSFNLKVVEALWENIAPTAACYYEVQLTKN